MGAEGEHDITQVLHAAAHGDSGAAARLLPLVYDELRALAGARMRDTPPGQTLQATALVHEAYLRLLGSGDSSWTNRGHFFYAAARAMRDILVEEARRKATLKRGGDRARVDLRDVVISIETPADDMLALDEVLARLEREDPRKHRLVMLRSFAGLSAEEAAQALDISLRTVERDWRYIKAWLHKELSSRSGNGHD
jgi:RNA polymerase sigma factor (TIGR02999 family)